MLTESRRKTVGAKTGGRSTVLACLHLQHVPQGVEILEIFPSIDQRPAEGGWDVLTAAESRLIKDHFGCHGFNSRRSVRHSTTDGEEESQFSSLWRTPSSRTLRERRWGLIARARAVRRISVPSEYL